MRDGITPGLGIVAIVGSYWQWILLTTVLVLGILRIDCEELILVQHIIVKSLTSGFFSVSFCRRWKTHGIRKLQINLYMKNMSSTAQYKLHEIQGNSITRDLPPTGSEANTTIFCIYVLDINLDSHCPYLHSWSTIWGNHLTFNLMLKFPISTI